MDNMTEHLILSHWDMFSECEEQNLGLSIDTSSSAYLIFTSGSSGKQKCTIGTHIGVINRCQYMWDSYPYNDNDVCCSKTVVSFTDFISEIFQPLLKVVPLRLVNDSWRTDIHVLVEALSQSKVTRLATVPSVLDTLFNMYDLPRVLPHLNHWESSGETLSVEVSRKYLSLSDSVTLLNVYGSSEVSSDLTFHRVTMSDVHRGVIPIGQPINGMKVYLVDEFQQLADQGEIVVSGVGLAKGYLNNELLTSERFVECQFDTCPAFSRMYKMGDFGKRLKNGDLVYLGRIDNQVKIRGMLVDLEEVEILIEKCPGVTKCVTKFWRESDSFGFLVAYLTLSQTQFEIQDIPLFLKDKLMDYMIPSKYVVLDQLPLNCNGKIDRSQLDKPIITVNSDYSNEVESDLCETINQILGIQVGPDDEIDSLGISSLNISLIKMKLKKDKGIIVSHRDFILSFTLRDLAIKVVHFAEAGDHADSYHTGIESPQQDRLHIPSDIHTWPNQFPVVDLHSGISFDYYDENDMDEVSLFAATIYETEEPLANSLRLSAAETLYFFTPFFMEVPNHNLSIIAKLNGKVVGCSLAIDNYNMNKLASPGNPIDPNWIERHAPVFEVLDKAMEGYQRIEQPGIVMYQSFTAIDPEVSKYGVGVILEKLSIVLGKKAGFQKAIAECSTLFTRILCEKNGYKFGPLVKYDPFIDSKGGRPFKGLPGGVVLAQLDLTTAEDDISNHYFPQSKAKVAQTLLGKAH